MSKRTAVLVTGSREWEDYAPIKERLDLYPPGTILIHGDCGEAVWTPAGFPVHDWRGRQQYRGADKIAGSIGFGKLNVWPLPYFGDLGKRGGPARNSCLLNILAQLSGSGFVCSVEAFPIGESRGTRGCIKMAEALATVLAKPLVITVTEGP